MNINKFIQKVWDCMTLKKSNKARVIDIGQTCVQLVSVKINKDEDYLRIQEIHHLVNKIILLGKKRGRPTKKDQEIEDAA